VMRSFVVAAAVVLEVLVLLCIMLLVPLPRDGGSLRIM
jgi:hypothetical protein